LRTGVLLMGITGLDILPGMFLLFLYARRADGFRSPQPGMLERICRLVSAQRHLGAACDCRLNRGSHRLSAAVARGLEDRLERLGALRLARWGRIRIGGRHFNLGRLRFRRVPVRLDGDLHWQALVARCGGPGDCGHHLLRCWPFHTCTISRMVPAGPGAGIPIQFTVRAFSMTALVPMWPGMPGWLRLILVNGSLLPLNYALEFGFFFFVAGVKWRQYRAGGEPPSRQDAACLTMLVTSTLICTFLRSSVNRHQRPGLARVFARTVRAAPLGGGSLAAARPAELPFRPRRLLTICIVLGRRRHVYTRSASFASTLILADRGVLPRSIGWPPTGSSARRNYAVRAAYEWVRATTPETAVLQYNPDVVLQETDAMLYWRSPRSWPRDLNCDTTLAAIPNSAPPSWRASTGSIPPNRPVSGSSEVCRDLPIDVLVAKDTDAVWSSGKLGLDGKARVF
jgi:hypothetical protein